MRTRGHGSRCVKIGNRHRQYPTHCHALRHALLLKRSASQPLTATWSSHITPALLPAQLLLRNHRVMRLHQPPPSPALSGEHVTMRLQCLRVRQAALSARCAAPRAPAARRGVPDTIRLSRAKPTLPRMPSWMLTRSAGLEQSLLSAFTVPSMV